jgi:PIN domain nuclease of toxin-antitoxin system
VRLLLDTHAIIWLYRGDKRLGKSASSSILQAEEIFVSVASAWEYGIKRANKPKDWPEPFDVLIKNMPAIGLGVDFDLHPYSEQLPPIHKDPFDRILVAQAIHHKLILVTKDKAISEYPVKTLW